MAAVIDIGPLPTADRAAWESATNTRWTSADSTSGLRQAVRTMDMPPVGTSSYRRLWWPNDYTETVDLSTSGGRGNDQGSGGQRRHTGVDVAGRSRQHQSP